MLVRFLLVHPQSACGIHTNLFLALTLPFKASSASFSDFHMRTHKVTRAPNFTLVYTNVQLQIVSEKHLWLRNEVQEKEKENRTESENLSHEPIAWSPNFFFVCLKCSAKAAEMG